MTVAVSIANWAAAYTLPILGMAIVLQLALSGVAFRSRLLRAGIAIVIPVLLFAIMAFEPSGALRWLVLSNR